MKKIFALVLSLVLVLSMAACGAKSTASGDLPTITIWSTGSQNVADTFNEVIAAYNAKADRKANVELQFILSGSGDEALSSRYGAAFQTGNYDNFDIIAENGTSFQGIIRECGENENAFLDIDASKLPNLANVKMTPSMYANKLVPYRGTTVVFAYDSAKVANPPQTWEELTQWIKDNPGRFAYNDPDTGGAGGSFLTCSLYRLVDDPEAMSNASDPKYLEMMDPGFNWLAEIHPYLYQSGGQIYYPVKNQGALDLLASGEIWITPAWADGTLDGLAKGTLPETVKMYQLSDLSLTGTDVDLGICANTPNVDACYDFINFVISPEGQQIFVDVMKAVPVIDAATLEQTDAVAAVSDLNPAAFNIVQTGNNDSELKTRWKDDIATLTTSVMPAY